MLLLLFFVNCQSAQIIYSNNFIQEIKGLQFTINSQSTYLVQLQILQFPQDQSYSPMMKVTYNVNDSTQSYYDGAGFYTKSQFQQITLNNTSLIAIQVELGQICNYTTNDNDLSFNYTLNIIESPNSIRQCLFPYYWIDCSQEIKEFITQSTQFNVSKQSWFYFYYTLQQSDYTVILQQSQLAVDNPNSDIGISLKPLGQPNYTTLPSFNTYFTLVNKTQGFTVGIKRQSSDSEYVIAIGIYNFNLTSMAKLTITLDENIQQSIVFPLWAIITIVGVVLLFIFVIIFLIIQLRKQMKVLAQEMPALSRELLNQYMPSKKIQPHLISESCCICLVQYKKSDQIRESPCRHFFHNTCLSEWTVKNATCPVCRLDFTEEELKKIYYCKQTEDSPLEKKKQLNFPNVTKVSQLQMIKSIQEPNQLENSTSQLKQQDQSNQSGLPLSPDVEQK